MKYIDTKKLVNYTINKITAEITGTYNEKEIGHFIKNYQCEKLRDIIIFLICQDCNSNIDADSLDIIKNLEEDLYESSLQIQLLENSVITAKESSNELNKQINTLNQSVQGGSDESNIIEQYNQILKANCLDYETEVKKLNLQSITPNIGSISL